MDLSNFDTKAGATRGAWLHLVAPNGQLLYADEADENGKYHKPMRIQLLGTDSDEFQAGAKRLAGGKQKPTAGNDEEKMYTLLAAVTKGWENIILNGAELEYTKENVKGLYRDYPFIFDQVFEFIQDRTAFLEN